MPMPDAWWFLRAWIGNPLRIAAVAPSSASAAALITADIDAHSGPVIELGPGTGVFTRALVGKGIPERDLTLIEYESDFARLLRQRFPRARVLCMDAARLRHTTVAEAASVGAVVSGLGLPLMPPRKIVAIVAGAFRHLRPGGAFYQITYGPRCPVPRAVLDRLGLRATRIGGTLRNFPPASIYRIVRRKPGLLTAG